MSQLRRSSLLDEETNAEVLLDTDDNVGVKVTKVSFVSEDSSSSPASTAELESGSSAEKSPCLRLERMESSYHFTKRASGQLGIPDFNRLPSFSQVDKDGNGQIELEEFMSCFPDLSEEEAKKIFSEADINHDGVVDRNEYTTWKMKAMDFARYLILPKNVIEDQKRNPTRYKDLYSCLPPPVFMIFITVVELIFFTYHWYSFKEEGKEVYNYGPPPLDSSLIYNPEKRYQIWRYVTYAFVHSGYMHIFNNAIVQLVLGVLLELVHRWWRVLIIYFAGVLAGSLATSVFHPFTYLAGASAGVYALIFAHLSTVILNWPEMSRPWVRVVCFAIFIMYDVGLAFYYAYYLQRDTNVGYPAHLGGGVAGLLTGIYILKNVRWERWEEILWYISVVIAAVLALFAIGWNLLNTGYYPESNYD